MVIDGRRRTVPPSSEAIGYSITKARGRHALTAGPAADLPVSVRAGIVVTGTEVLTGRVQRPQRPVAGRAAARAGGGPRVHDDRRATAPRTWRRRCGSWPSRGMDLVAHQRRAGADRGRPHGRGGGTVPGPRDGARRGARGAHRGDRAAAAETLAEPRQEAIREGNRKQATVPDGATVLEPVGTAPGLVVPPRERGERPDGRRAARARRASCSRCGAQAVETEALRAALQGATVYRAADAAAVRDPRVGDRRDAARGRARGRRARAPGDHDVPETRRDRGRDALRARRRGRLRGVRAGRRASATRTRCSRRRHARSTSRWRRCCAARRARGAAAARRGRSPRPSRAPAGCWRRA